MPFVWSKRFRVVQQPVYEVIPEITIPEFIAEEVVEEETQ
jgi:hypothetical protein